MAWGPHHFARAQDGAEAGVWGPESNGLRCRVVAIDPKTDDEQPDLTATVDSFATGDDVTLGVELKNVGEKPVTLLGVRYGESYPTAKGKLNTASMAPHLFALELTDAAGKAITRPQREFIDASIQVDSTSLHELAPGASLVVALRPTKFGFDTAYQFPPGEYRVRVRYHGLEGRVRKRLAERSADRPQASAWSGDAASEFVAFAVEGGPPVEEPQWGEPVEGLRAAVVLKPRAGAAGPDDPPDFVPLGSAVDAALLFENVSEAPIALASESWRQDDQITVTNDAGEAQDLSGMWYSGWPIVLRWTLQPGEVAEVSAAGLAVVAKKADAEHVEHPVGRVFEATPGRYTLHYTVRMGGMQMKDGKGNVLVPLRNDWQGTITTGEARLGVRARTPADDTRKSE
jgi:hypothetical protein